MISGVIEGACEFDQPEAHPEGSRNFNVVVTPEHLMGACLKARVGERFSTRPTEVSRAISRSASTYLNASSIARLVGDMRASALGIDIGAICT